MKKLASLTTMAFLLATAGLFAQAPSTTPAAGAKPAAKTKTVHKGHKKVVKTTTTPAAVPAQK